MQHVAIDLGGRASQVCVRSSRGEIVAEHRILTGLLQRFLADQPVSRVVMETCSESFTVAGWARDAGHEVRIVPASSVRALGVGARGIKTEVRDAQVLSDVSTKIDLASVHVPSELAKERRMRCTAREAMVEARVQLVNSVRGYLRQRVLHVRCTSETLPRKARSLLVETSDGLPSYIDQLLSAIEALTSQIHAADQELAEHRRPSRQAQGHHGAFPQTRRCPVRDVARPGPLQSQAYRQRRASPCVTPRCQDLPVSESLPRRLSKSRDRERARRGTISSRTPLHTNAACSRTPSCVSNANSRLKTARSGSPRKRCLFSAEPHGGPSLRLRYALTARPLHSRTTTKTLTPTTTVPVRAQTLPRRGNYVATRKVVLEMAQSFREPM